MNPFQSLRDYEEFVYTLQESFPAIQSSSLVSTHPHHKHISPNIKRNRIPAPQISFIEPNLPVLIQEIQDLVKETEEKLDE